jgi:hypothetical protein
VSGTQQDKFVVGQTYRMIEEGQTTLAWEVTKPLGMYKPPHGGVEYRGWWYKMILPRDENFALGLEGVFTPDSAMATRGVLWTVPERAAHYLLTGEK